MPFIATTATHKILQLNKRLRGVSGGTSASKTISILIWLINYAQTHNEVISVVSETLPHLKRGAIRDFLNIMTEQHYFKDDRWNKTELTYSFETGSKIEFFSVDQPERVRGPRRDVLFVNEANSISYETFTQLEIRTSKIIWCDWNPVAEFWWYTEVLPHLDCDFITLTYLDNEAFPEESKKALEARKFNQGWWKVYGEGQLGIAEGRIYTNWEMIDAVPMDARLERYGLDFGYTNDPTSLISLYKYNDTFILDEILYMNGLSNREIATQILHLPRAIVVADSAEPKSIDEIKGYGVVIIPSTKGEGSVKQGIQFVQDQKIAVTKKSLNIIKEYRNYLWEIDRDGKTTNEPSPILNHSMDAIRYALSGYFVKLPPQYHAPNKEKLMQAGALTEFGGIVGY